MTGYRSFGPCDSPFPADRFVHGRLELTTRISVCLMSDRGMHAYLPVPVVSALAHRILWTDRGYAASRRFALLSDSVSGSGCTMLI